MEDRNLADAAPSTVTSNYPNSGLESEMKAELKRQGLEIENLKRMFANFHHQGNGKESAANQAVTVTSIPRFISDEDRFIEGIKRYLEGIEPKTNIYASYAQWYDDLFKKINVEVFDHYSDKYYIAIRTRRYADIKKIKFRCSTEEKDPQSGVVNFEIQTKSLEEGFTHRNTKLVCILHPENPEECVELKQTEEEFNGRGLTCGYKWGSNQTYKIERCCKAHSGYRSVILCAIKY